MLLYTIKKHDNTGEHHIFEGEMTSVNPLQCIVPAESVCRKAKNSETVFVGQTCLKELGARVAAAHLGRVVCGTCISHLYATPVR